MNHYLLQNYFKNEIAIQTYKDTTDISIEFNLKQDIILPNTSYKIKQCFDYTLGISAQDNTDFIVFDLMKRKDNSNNLAQ